MGKLVYGVGINSKKYKAFVDGRPIKEYKLWNSMLKRCYGDKYHLLQPTYKGCAVSDNFKHYEYFYEWCHKQIGFNNEGWQLDKDLLIKGNKIYSEDTCVFLPNGINLILTKRDSSRGELPIGVYYKKQDKKFASNMSLDGRMKHLGCFDNEIEAFNAYKVAKEKYIKELAEKWNGEIDERAYKALVDYRVEITD